MGGEAGTSAAARAAVTAAKLIVLNYVVQTTFVPALVRDFRPENGPLVAALMLVLAIVSLRGHGSTGVAKLMEAP